MAETLRMATGARQSPRSPFPRDSRQVTAATGLASLFASGNALAALDWRWMPACKASLTRKAACTMVSAAIDRSAGTD
jgi:hypothetical protein